MKYIKNYQTISNATSDKSIIAPLLCYCQELNQSLFKGGEADQPLSIKLIDGKLVAEEKQAILPIKDSKGYYIVEGVSQIQPDQSLYATSEGKLTLASEGNTKIATFSHGDYQSIKGLYSFYANDYFIYPTNTLPQTAPFIKVNDTLFPQETYTAKDTMDYVINHEEYDPSTFGLHNDCYNYQTLGTQKGDWHIPMDYEMDSYVCRYHSYKPYRNSDIAPYLPSNVIAIHQEFTISKNKDMNAFYFIPTPSRSLHAMAAYWVTGEIRQNYDINQTSGAYNKQVYFRPHIYIKDFGVFNENNVFVAVKYNQTYAEQNITLYSQNTYSSSKGEAAEDFIIDNNRYPVLDENVILSCVNIN